MEQLTHTTKERMEAQKRGMMLGLADMRAILRVLGDPQDSLRFLHLAGTNGKGSTAAFLTRILREAGYCTGQYLSPGVISVREIIQVDGEMISEEDYQSLFAEISAAAEAAGVQPTLFEIETSMAFLYFARRGCDYVVLECGLGGDLDATNVVTTTVCSVLASISLDHTRILGKTTAEIAGHKTGILKDGVPCAALRNADPSVTEVIEQAAEAHGSELVWADPESCGFEVAEGRTWLTKDGVRYELGLPGHFQRQNAALALTVIDILKKRGAEITEDAVERGLRKTEWPARMQRLSDRPVVIADGGHNPDAARELAESLKIYFTNRRFFYIIGMLRDKDYPEVMRLMLPLAEAVWTLTPDSPRALTGAELAEEIRRQRGDIPVTETHSVKEALELAKSAAGPDGIVVAFGSFTYMGELIQEARSGNSEGGR